MAASDDKNDALTDLDITDLFNHFATLTICTYLVLYVNVPEQKPGRKLGWRDTIWSRVHWASHVLMFPELWFSRTMSDWAIAWTELHRLHEAKPETKETWRVTHMFLAQMGGFAVEYNGTRPFETEVDAAADKSVDVEMKKSRNITTDPGLQERVNQAWGDARTGDHQESSDCNDNDAQTVADADDLSLKESRSNLEPLLPRETETEPLKTDEAASEAQLPKIFHLTASSVRQGIVQGVLPFAVPPAGEFLMRPIVLYLIVFMASFTSTRFLIQLGYRYFQGRPIIPLDLGVLSLVVATSITFYFVQGKPKNITTTIALRSYEGDLPQEIEELDCGKDVTEINDLKKGQPVPNELGTYYFGWVVAMALPVGVIHLCGWNMTFPTTVDAWLWRINALNTGLGTSWCIFAVVLLENLRASMEAVRQPNAEGDSKMPAEKARTTAGAYATHYLKCAWVFSKVILFVEMCRCVFYL